MFVVFSKDTKGIGRHIHVTVDEIVFVYKGEEKCISTASGFR